MLIVWVQPTDTLVGMSPEQGTGRATAMCLAVVLALAAPATAALASLRLITLDLDDTLWPTGPVVSSANIALATAVGGDPKDLQARLRTARSGTDKPSYSEARILAIESWLNERDGKASGHRDAAEGFFDLWLAERHAAAGRLLFDGAAEAVAAVRRQHPDALIAAVTNGRGDPLVMPALRPHFDFTISAEDASIYPERKPAAAPFLAALRRAGVTRPTPALWAHVRRRSHTHSNPPGSRMAGSQGAARGVEASACHPPQPQPPLGGKRPVQRRAGCNPVPPGLQPYVCRWATIWSTTCRRPSASARGQSGWATPRPPTRNRAVAARRSPRPRPTTRWRPALLAGTRPRAPRSAPRACSRQTRRAAAPTRPLARSASCLPRCQPPAEGADVRARSQVWDRDAAVSRAGTAPAWGC